MNYEVLEEHEMTDEAPEDDFSIHWIEDVVEEVLQRNDEEYLMSVSCGNLSSAM